jgi:hypothetical protein
MKFVLGLALGLVIGAVATASAASFAGCSDGYLEGWYVKKGARFVCAEPVSDASLKTIECDSN